MPRLIWVFAGRTVILLVLSWDGSYLLGCWHCQIPEKTKEQANAIITNFSMFLNQSDLKWPDVCMAYVSKYEMEHVFIPRIKFRRTCMDEGQSKLHMYPFRVAKTFWLYSEFRTFTVLAFDELMFTGYCVSQWQRRVILFPQQGVI